MTKTYFFLRSATTGEYLQHQWDARTGKDAFWFAANRGWSPCCASMAKAEAFKAALPGMQLVISEEML